MYYWMDFIFQNWDYFGYFNRNRSIDISYLFRKKTKKYICYYRNNWSCYFNCNDGGSIMDGIHIHIAKSNDGCGYDG